MTRKEQNKILDDKIQSNVNQYKVDRLNAEISGFSSGDLNKYELNAEISGFSSGNLNKYEFLTRTDLKYRPNALDKARFEFSPLGKTFSTGLDKTAQGYQEEGVIKLLKDIRDGLRGGLNRLDDMVMIDQIDEIDQIDLMTMMMIIMMIMIMIMMMIIMMIIMIKFQNIKKLSVLY